MLFTLLSQAHQLVERSPELLEVNYLMLPVVNQITTLFSVLTATYITNGKRTIKKLNSLAEF